jgi:hypothetical protein
MWVVWLMATAGLAVMSYGVQKVLVVIWANLRDRKRSLSLRQ